MNNQQNNLGEVVLYCNLDAILSVGYRVNSKRGTQFRIWATLTLKDHLVRGYTLNERRLCGHNNLPPHLPTRCTTRTRRPT